MIVLQNYSTELSRNKFTYHIPIDMNLPNVFFPLLFFSLFVVVVAPVAPAVVFMKQNLYIPLTGLELAI